MKSKGKPVQYNQAKTLVAVPLFRLRVVPSKKQKLSKKKFDLRQSEVTQW
jgi:stalled ribosome alternative rescue factor ArfA